MATKMLASALLSLLLIPFARAGVSFDKCYNIATSNSSLYYSSSGLIHPCGNDVYNTCCEIGDYCIEGGFCEAASSYYSSSSASVYYLGGCTDSTGEDPDACGGYCPRGSISGSSGSSTSNYYSYLVWQTSLQQWMCCPSSASASSSCVMPVAADGVGSIDNEYSDPSELIRTASVVGSSSFYSYGYGYNPTASTSSYYGYSYPTSTGYGYGSGSGSGGYGSSSNDYDYDDNPFGWGTTLLVIVIVVPVLVGSFLIALLIWLIVHKCKKSNRKAIPVMPGNPSEWPLPQGQVVYPYVMAGNGQSAAEAQREYEQKMAAAGWVARQPPQVASAQQQQHQGQNPEMSQIGQEGPTQPVPAAAASGSPRGVSRSLSPAASQASWLPPIQEVAPIDKQEIDAAAAVPTPSAEEPAREVADGPATAAATTTTTTTGTESGGNESSWPLGSSGAEQSQTAGPSTTAAAGGSGAADHTAAPRRSGDLYD